MASDGDLRRVRDRECPNQSGDPGQAGAVSPLPQRAGARTQREDEYGRAHAHRSRPGPAREGDRSVSSGAQGQAMNPFGVERRAEQTLWDVRDVARYLKASVSWVYKAAERGELPCIRVGGLLRFDPRAVRAFAAGPSERSGNMERRAAQRGWRWGPATRNGGAG